MMDKNCFNIKNLIGKKWFILLLNTAFFALMAWLLPMHYEDNDDVVMCMIANGGLSGTPDGHLVYINALYGWIIAGLYRLTKIVEWYSLAFCIIHILAMSIISFIIIKDCKWRPLLKFLFFVFLYVFWAHIIIYFQFTTTAGLLCFCGCLALIQPSKKLKVIGVCAVFVASLIRFKAVGLVGLLCAPFLIMRFFEDKRFAYWAMAVIFGVLFGHWADGFCYKQSGWKEYKSYNSVRGSFNDTPNAYLVIDDLPEGIEKEDYLQFLNFQGDPKIMTLTKLQDIQSKITTRITWQDAISNLSNLYDYKIPISILVLGYFVCFILSCHRSNSTWLLFVLLGSFFIWVFLLLYLGAMATFKERVFFCMLLPEFFIIVKSFSLIESNRHNLFFGMFFICVIIGMILRCSYQDYKAFKVSTRIKNSFINFQLSLFDELENQDWCLCLRCCNYEYLPVMHIKDFGFRRVGFGWTTNIPFQKGILESHRDFVDSNILYFGEVAAPPVALVERIEKNYGIKNELVIVNKNEWFALYKFVSK